MGSDTLEDDGVSKIIEELDTRVEIGGFNNNKVRYILQFL